MLVRCLLEATRASQRGCPEHYAKINGENGKNRIDYFQAQLIKIHPDVRAGTVLMFDTNPLVRTKSYVFNSAVNVAWNVLCFECK